MGQFTDIQSADGFVFPAYVAQPTGRAKGAVVVLQEIFGVNGHIRDVADGYAAEGYLAVAPSTFHRVKPGVDIGYTEDDMKAGMALKAAVEGLPAPGVMTDIQAAVKHASQAGKVGIVGYCWGGLSAAVTYYGGGMTTPNEVARQPKVPVLSHFGDQDHWISLESVEAFKKVHAEVEVHVYHANHGFNCDRRGAWEPNAAKLARERTLVFFGKHLA